MYAMFCTRPDIAHAMGVVSRYMNNPGKEHWEAVKWILRYRDMLIQIWQVIKTTGGAPQGMFLL